MFNRFKQLWAKKPQPELGFVCNENWDAMDGDKSQRHCQQCSCTVFNLDEMAASKAQQLISDAQSAGQRVCVRYTPTAKKSSVALKWLQQPAAAIVAGLLALFPSFMHTAQAVEQKRAVSPDPAANETIMGDIAPPPPKEPPKSPKSSKLTTMGVMAVPSKPAPKTKPKREVPPCKKSDKHPVPLMGKVTPSKPPVKPNPQKQSQQIDVMPPQVMGELYIPPSPNE